ncbi:UNVERIFIED_CONTAM: hypothetical protein K2H54_048590 [Gekko kuhli]
MSATLEPMVPAGDSTINVHVMSIQGFIVGTVVLFILIGIIVWATCCFSPSPKRLARRRTLFDLSATCSYDGDDSPSLRSDNVEVAEDALSIQGLSPEDQSEPLVKFRRAKPGKPDDPPVTSQPAPGDVLEL